MRIDFKRLGNKLTIGTATSEMWPYLPAPGALVELCVDEKLTWFQVDTVCFRPCAATPCIEIHVRNL
jgi:hypothetical protein